MKKINSTHFLRQMKFRSDFQFVLTTILLIPILFWIVSRPLLRHPGSYSSWSIDIIHPDYLTDFNSMVKVYIQRDGTIYVNKAIYEYSLSQLSYSIIEAMNDNSSKKDKVVLIASENLQFEKIVNILNQIKISGIRSVFLTDWGKYSKLDVWRESGKLQKTWLYQPEMLIKD